MAHKRIIKKVTTIAILLLLICITQGKVYSKNVPIMNFRRDSGWLFIDRININPGTLQIQLAIKMMAQDFKIGSQFLLVFSAVPAELWEAESNNKCDTSKFTNEQLQERYKKEKTHMIVLNSQNNFQIKSQINFQIENSTTLNFVLRDCSQTVLKQNFGRGASFQIDIQTFMNGEYRSSSQQMYNWLLPCLSLLCLSTIYYLKYTNKEDEDNWIKYILKISLWFAFSATLLKYIGFIIYAYISGDDYQFFDFMYLLLYSVSDSIIIVLLLLLAFGWTVIFSSTKDFDLYVPLASMLGMINVIMTALNKVTDGDHDKYHIFDSIPAYIMVFFRLVGFGVFAAGIIRSFLKLKQDQKKAFRYFVQLAVLGTIYLTFIPASLVLITFIDSNSRKQGMFFFIEAGKYVLSIWLGYLSGSKNSVYRNIIEGSFMEKGDKYY